jgi:hypothetical protein
MCLRLAAALAAVVFMSSAPARADLLIKVDKSAQQMTVTEDGNLLYTWPVSTGRAGYNTPNGAFTPFRMDRDHFSREWDNAPMPYSIFFTQQGDAIHGTYEARYLGHAVSHGCVRLSVQHAAILWDLVKKNKMTHTAVLLTGNIPGGGAAVMARARPQRHDEGDVAQQDQNIDQDGDRVAVVPPRQFLGGNEWQDDDSDGPPPSYGEREPRYRYARPRGLFPFFPFGW